MTVVKNNMVLCLSEPTKEILEAMHFPMPHPDAEYLAFSEDGTCTAFEDLSLGGLVIPKFHLLSYYTNIDLDFENWNEE